VPFRGDFILLVLNVSSKTLGMATSNFKFRWFASVQTHHDFVMKQGLRFELKILRSRREIAIFRFKSIKMFPFRSAAVSGTTNVFTLVLSNQILGGAIV